jgi:hypothetical protein
MAITINGTDGLTSDNGALKLDGTTLVVDDTNNRVGVGIASPTNTLHVYGGSNTQFKVQSSGAEANMTLDGTSYAQINNATGDLYVTTDQSSTNIILRTASTERVRISQYGLSFNGDTAAANALDDYEEGTYTPVATSDSGTITSYTASGTYVKIGKIVQVAYKIGLVDVGSAAGKLQITMPFTHVNFIRPVVACTREDQVTGVGYLSFGEANSTMLRIGTFSNGGIVWTNGYGYVGSCTYEAA